MNLREIDVCEPKSRLRKISRWILAAEGDYIKERERERGHFVSQFVRDNRFRDVGNLVGERGVCPPKKDGR